MLGTANLAMFIGILFAVIPAMAILYKLLYRFEGFFDEKRLFKYLLIGMLVGSLITTLEVVAFGFHDPFRLQSLPLRAGLFALLATYPLLDGAAKTAIMNWHTIAGKPDAPYYGVSMGIGLGAISTFILVARVYQLFLISPGAALLSHTELAVFSLLLMVLFVGGIALHAVAGVQVAKATGEREILRALGLGVALAMPFYIAYYFFWSSTTAWGRFVAPISLALVGYWALKRFALQALEEIVPEELARQVRRDMRKRERGPDQPGKSL